MVTHPAFWTGLLISVPVYWAVAPAWRPRVIVIASLAVLLSFEGYGCATEGWAACVTPARQALVVLLAASWVVYRFAAAPSAGPLRKPVAWLIAGLLAYLAYHKYLPPILGQLGPGERLLVPLGLSYFTFKLIHYAVERSRDRFTAHGYMDFLAYLLLFPIYTAGPIERFDHFLGHRAARFQGAMAAEGGVRIAHGLVKKFFLSDLVLLPLLGDEGPRSILTAAREGVPLPELWGLVLVWYLIVYLDFSAYSDIAIGASRLFGLTIMENFNWPILASNIGDFWKRWHMTLAGWCQAYVYLPVLGVTRQPYLAVFATFLAIGLWHAGSLSWVLWGLYHGTGVAAFLTWSRWLRQRGYRRPSGVLLRVVGVVVTGAFVSLGFVFTALDRPGHGLADVRQALFVILRCLGIDVS